MEKAYKYRLYPNGVQKQLLEKHFGATRWIYNYGLERKIKTYQDSKTKISCFEIIKEIPKLKQQEETKWLKEINAQSLQMSLRSLDNAYTKFFRDKKGFPKFKNKFSKRSFSIPQGNKIDFEKSIASFIKIGKIKIRIDRSFEGRIIKATIDKNSVNQYFVSYTVIDKTKEKKPKKIRERTTIGIDLGLKHFIVMSNGTRIENPKYLKQSEKRLGVLQRRLSRKQKGSQNRQKAKLKVAKIHLKIKNQRSDFLHKLTGQLTHENQVDSYALETLQVNNMMKNHHLAKSIQDASWSEFVRQMEYKCRWYGKNLLRIGTFEPSSKMCLCGIVNQTLTLANREWTCRSCQRVNDRDLTAAINIKNFALSGRGTPREPVELSQQGNEEAGIKLLN